MVEAETTTLGTSIRILKMMELCGLVKLKKCIDGKIRVGEEDLSNWLIIVGGELTPNHILSFMDKLYDNSLSFPD